jgi:hypothetical protein
MPFYVYGDNYGNLCSGSILYRTNSFRRGKFDCLGTNLYCGKMYGLLFRKFKLKMEEKAFKSPFPINKNVDFSYPKISPAYYEYLKIYGQRITASAFVAPATVTLYTVPKGFLFYLETVFAWNDGQDAEVYVRTDNTAGVLLAVQRQALNFGNNESISYSMPMLLREGEKILLGSTSFTVLCGKGIISGFLVPKELVERLNKALPSF